MLGTVSIGRHGSDPTNGTLSPIQRRLLGVLSMRDLLSVADVRPAPGGPVEVPRGLKGVIVTDTEVGDVRGLGAMVAFELVAERGGNEPDSATTGALIKKAEENGLVLLSCGVFGNSVRILVPLTASDEIVDEGLDIIERSMTELAGAS